MVDFKEFDTLIDGSHKYTDVFSDGYRGPGEAFHHYEVRRKGEKVVLMRFNFQDGPIKETGINGIMDENLIAMVIDRLQGFQSGPYSSLYNALALTKLEEALMWLRKRTKDRETRGVEGTHKV